MQYESSEKSEVSRRQENSRFKWVSKGLIEDIYCFQLVTLTFTHIDS